jgi:molybdopterin-guanine dinucleotide biosynthesis protein A
VKTKNNITGIILSGGQSLRMGENKAFIKIDGIPIINRIHSVFKKLFQEVIIVTNQKELFSNFDAKIYVDIIPDCGVLAGLYTGLFFSSFPYSFCVACDMPYLKESVIEFLIGGLNDFDVIVPKTVDGLQPLHAVYSKKCLPAIRKTIQDGKSKILDFYPMVKIKLVEEQEFHFLDPGMESFINVNTPEQLRLVQERKPLH